MFHPTFIPCVMAGKISPIQSPARPFGLDIIGPVQMAASDRNASKFYNDYLPKIEQLINADFNVNFSINNFSAVELDPSKIYATNNVAIEAFFITEDTDYHNTLGFNTSGGSIKEGNPWLIFPDASTSVPYDQVTSPFGKRTIETPLLPGDFVELGKYSKTSLDFFLIADGANGGTDVYSTQSSINPDGLVHAFAYAIEDSPYLIMGFDGIDTSNGANKDLIFALDLDKRNVSSLIETASITHAPEPSTLLILTSFLGFTAYIKHRKRR
jgi:hypothetical protein